MLKSFLIIINLHIFIYASQIVLLVSKNSDISKAKLQCFEENKKIGSIIDVNIGKNGLGVGISELFSFAKKDEVFKQEGDKKAPLGIFRLTSSFGYAKTFNTKMPYIQATKDLICVDDSDSINYNRIINMPKERPKSFEYMKRDDNQYSLGVVVEHNKKQLKNGGSCIFIHVEKSKDAPTAGCTSMRYKELKRILEWLDIKKEPILIQVSEKYIGEVKKLYPELPLDL